MKAPSLLLFTSEKKLEYTLYAVEKNSMILILFTFLC